MQQGTNNPAAGKACVDERKGNNGPVSRRTDIKTLLMIAALVINFLVVIWKGGQISEQFETLLETVSKMQTQMETVLKNMAEAKSERLVQAERLTNLATNLNKQDARLEHIERAERAERAASSRGQ